MRISTTDILRLGREYIADQAERTVIECRPMLRGKIRPVHSFHLLTLDLALLVDIAWLET